MAIDLETEKLIPLREAADLLPRMRRGKGIAYSTLWRWALRGTRGVRLESVRVPGGLATTKEAVQRFIMALGSAQSTSAREVPVSYRTRQADAVLRRAGLKETRRG